MEVGAAVNFEIVVCNSGATTELPFKLGLVLNAGAAPPCGGPFDEQMNITDGIHGGLCATHNIYTTLAPGARQAWIVADSQCALAEINDSNNSATVPVVVAPSQPDLYVKSLTPAVNGSTVSYSAEICNAGKATSSDISTSLYYNRTTQPACSDPTAPEHTFVSSGGLGANSCVTLTHVRTGATPGNYTANAFVDQDCRIGESLDTNNFRTAAYAVAQPTQPDLTISSLEVSVRGTAVTYTAQVCNTGTAAAPASTVGLYQSRPTAPGCGETPNETASVGALAISACETKTWTKTGVSAGTFTAWALADSPCSIGELSDTNNSKSQGYTVAAVSPDGGAPDAMRADASPTSDGSTTLDGAVGADGGATLDGRVATNDGAGGRDAASPDRSSVDGAVSADADAPLPSSSDSGCGCRLSSSRDGDVLAAALLLGALVLLRLRRQRRRAANSTRVF